MDGAWSLLRFDKLTKLDLLDILLVAIVIYAAVAAVRGTRAAQMLIGIGLLFVAYEVTDLTGLRTLHKVLEYAFRYIPFVVIVVFQAEIRRALTALGKNPLLRMFHASHGTDEVLNEVVYAVTSLSSRRTGALIVLERSQRLKNYTEAGIALDALVSYDLLINVFTHETPLHDGAVIISEGRVASASCFLPLTLQPSLSKQYGTRHRAAIGVTEETDAVAVVVSEETGEVSVAVAGRMTSGLWAEALIQHLRSLFGAPAETGKKADAASQA